MIFCTHYDVLVCDLAVSFCTAVIKKSTTDIKEQKPEAFFFVTKEKKPTKELVSFCIHTLLNMIILLHYLKSI